MGDNSTPHADPVWPPCERDTGCEFNSGAKRAGGGAVGSRLDRPPSAQELKRSPSSQSARGHSAHNRETACPEPVHTNWHIAWCEAVTSRAGQEGQDLRRKSNKGVRASRPALHAIRSLRSPGCRTHHYGEILWGVIRTCCYRNSGSESIYLLL